MSPVEYEFYIVEYWDWVLETFGPSYYMKVRYEEAIKEEENDATE